MTNINANFHLTGEIDIEELNKILSKNPEANTILYNKLKKINQSKRQAFLIKMFSRYISKRIKESSFVFEDSSIKEAFTYIKTDEVKIKMSIKTPSVNLTEKLDLPVEHTTGKSFFVI